MAPSSRPNYPIYPTFMNSRRAFSPCRITWDGKSHTFFIRYSPICVNFVSNETPKEVALNG